MVQLWSTDREKNGPDVMAAGGCARHDPFSGPVFYSANGLSDTWFTRPTSADPHWFRGTLQCGQSCGEYGSSQLSSSRQAVAGPTQAPLADLQVVHQSSPNWCSQGNSPWTEAARRQAAPPKRPLFICAAGTGSGGERGGGGEGALARAGHSSPPHRQPRSRGHGRGEGGGLAPHVRRHCRVITGRSFGSRSPKGFRDRDRPAANSAGSPSCNGDP